MVIPISRRVIVAAGLALLPLVGPVMGARAEPQLSGNPADWPPLQRHRIEARSDIEVRVSTMVERDCNRMGIVGQLQPEPTGSQEEMVWKLMNNGQPGGIISTLMYCPDHPVERVRLVLNEGRPTTIPWRGETVPIDLPEGWLLEWRPKGNDQPFINVEAL